METTRSHRTTFNRAYQLGLRLFKPHAHKFARHDFTEAQLFACVVLRESMRLSYRKAEAFLRDAPEWMADVGMAVAPDHNTIWNAFGRLLEGKRTRRALDLLAEDDARRLKRELKAKPASMDSTCFELRHRSRHDDRVCRKLRLKPGEKYAENARKQAKYDADVARSRAVKRLPKLALAISAGSGHILAARCRIGNRSDARDFAPLLFDAWRRAPVKMIVADAGYDSEANHMTARDDMGVRSIIPAKIGRPTKKQPSGYYRRLMKKRFQKKSDAKAYGQRARSESVNSAMKRNLGESLRSIRPDRQKQEMMLRAIVHNLMLGPDESERRD
jgi:hypothetical protein